MRSNSILLTLVMSDQMPIKYYPVNYIVYQSAFLLDKSQIMCTLKSVKAESNILLQSSFYFKFKPTFHFKLN